uniref:Uncharacterized protein n=1 Tax=Knipowitschia caucasica TaxID=637954 RepID=A0AAV2LUS2_KNICA
MQDCPLSSRLFTQFHRDCGIVEVNEFDWLGGCANECAGISSEPGEESEAVGVPASHHLDMAVSLLL